jgi:hypothetical protein
VELETTYQSLFDNTADVKAQNKVIQWYILNLTYIREEADDEPSPFFAGDTFKEKLEKFYEFEDSEDEFYQQIISKVSPIMTLWFFQGLSTKDEIDEMMEKIENEEW